MHPAEESEQRWFLDYRWTTNLEIDGHSDASGRPRDTGWVLVRLIRQGRPLRNPVFPYPRYENVRWRAQSFRRSVSRDDKECGFPCSKKSR